ncbi:hypothetical protein pb186bvf_008542 [Paramecium bursaria]
MLQIFFIFLLICISLCQIDLSSAYYCDCTEYSIQSDCESANCLWQTPLCTQPSCTNATQDNCNNLFGCAYYNNTCSTFTQCSDYSLTTNDGCSQLGCILNSTSGNICAQNNTKLNCTSISDETACNNTVGCIYNSTGKTCRGQVCSDVDNQTDCLIVDGDEGAQYLCQWDPQNNCTDAQDGSQFNETNCYNMTEGKFHWNNSTQNCRSCKGQIPAFVPNMIINYILYLLI